MKNKNVKDNKQQVKDKKIERATEKRRNRRETGNKRQKIEKYDNKSTKEKQGVGKEKVDSCCASYYKKEIIN